MTAVVLDISRLISRVRYATPSGVDRVEMAYARGLLGRYGKDLSFAAVHPTGRYGRIDHVTALAYLDELEQRWAHSENEPPQRSLASIMPWMVRLLPRSGDVGSAAKGAVYVQTSPHHLTDGAKVERILQRENARFLCMVHDLIPIEYPEYARPGGADLHRRRIETVTRCADAVIVNSAATGRSLQPWIAASGRDIATHVAYLGTEPLPPASAKVPDGERPYMVCIGTIEGRKNHLLLLHLWRQMARTMAASEFPRLIIIGKRGWENAQVLAMLDRCAELEGHVEEVSGCSDTRLATLLRNARTLLMPSFAEGYGMPVAEALSVSVPVICSDIAAHREVGGDAPDYADPLDGQRWQELVLDHGRKGPFWQAQKARIPAWHNPDWDAHMEIVAKAIEALAR